MTYTAQYTDADHTMIARSDMPETFIPAVSGNRHYNEIVRDGITILPFEQPPVTRAKVNVERDRRTDAGFMFGGVLYQSAPSAREDIAGAYSLAQTAILIGGAQPGDLRWHGGAKDFVWIAADNTQVPMDAQTVLAFGGAALDHKAALIFAASAIKAMDPIPADYASNESYWV